MIVEIDPIDLPEETARAREPINIEQRDHPAWPEGIIEVLMDWNNAANYWTWEVTIDGSTAIARQPAEYAHTYRFGDYIWFTFLDLSGATSSVAPETLGSSVDLIAFPGIRSPGFGGWLDRQRPDDTERESLLNEWETNVIQS
ncbi:hypothetical protein [Halocatena halophila]|uniref:hypothetical protein n=1 Tax=Halocatena halophila TaxID=2814576 RepID=UPI002ED60F46